MGYVGFEPTTNRLKAEYSTAELITLVPRLGFEPRNNGSKTRCLTAWRSRIEAEVVGFEPTDAH